jgi:nucleoside-diphosphate-sugar epimerase
MGRRVVAALAARGCEVISLDIVSASFDGLGAAVRSAQMDLTDFEALVAALRRYRPEVIINLSYLRKDLPRVAIKLNVLGMDNCFEAARLCEVPHVVFSSSTAVYGSQSRYGPRPVTEADETAPINQYGMHKVFNEWQARDYRDQHGLCVTSLRVPWVSGPDKSVGTVDHVHCITRPARGESVTFPYRDSMRCLIHVDDVGELFARVALSPRPRHAIYNCGGATLSLGDLAERVRGMLPSADIRFEQQSGDQDRSGAYRFDDSRIREEFGFECPPFELRIAQMIEQARGP